VKTTYIGNKVTIRPITRDDTDHIVLWRNNSSVLQNFIDQTRITPEIHSAWLEKKVLTGEVYQFIIQDNETKRDVGSVFLRDIDTYHLHGEYGVFIGDDACRGRGLGTEACLLICRFAFEQLGLNRVFLRVIASNTAAIRSYEKVGFVQEGVFRKHVKLNGAWCDLIFMGLLKEEFENEK
jgi:RimJ/RimL family protein N-acetyltransferase